MTQEEVITDIDYINNKIVELYKHYEDLIYRVHQGEAYEVLANNIIKNMERVTELRTLAKEAHIKHIPPTAGVLDFCSPTQGN